MMTFAVLGTNRNRTLNSNSGGRAA